MVFLNGGHDLHGRPPREAAPKIHPAWQAHAPEEGKSKLGAFPDEPNLNTLHAGVFFQRIRQISQRK
jgi:hypothetical protein